MSFWSKNISTFQVTIFCEIQFLFLSAIFGVYFNLDELIEASLYLIHLVIGNLILFSMFFRIFFYIKKSIFIEKSEHGPLTSYITSFMEVLTILLFLEKCLLNDLIESSIIADSKFFFKFFIFSIIIFFAVKLYKIREKYNIVCSMV